MEYTINGKVYHVSDEETDALLSALQKTEGEDLPNQLAASFAGTGLVDIQLPEPIIQDTDFEEAGEDQPALES